MDQEELTKSRPDECTQVVAQAWVDLYQFLDDRGVASSSACAGAGAGATASSTQNQSGDVPCWRCVAEDARAYIDKISAFEYILYVVIGDSGRVICKQLVTNQMNFAFDKQNHSIRFVVQASRDAMIALSLVFKDDSDENKMALYLTVAMYEYERKKPMFKSVATQDREWLQQAKTVDEPDDDLPLPTADAMDFEMDDGSSGYTHDSDDDDDDDDDDDNDDEAPQYGAGKSQAIFSTPKRARYRTNPFHSPKADLPEDNDAKHNSDAKEKNSSLNVGMLNNRTFVVRGSNIGVFHHDSQDNMGYLDNIPVVTAQNTMLSPAKTLLHRSEANLLLLDGKQRNRVHQMDLHRGEIVNSWQVHSSDDVSLRHFAPKSKFSQRSDEQTFVGISDQGVMLMDPRVNGPIAVQKSSYMYKSKTALGCAATTSAGHVAVGSDTGEIRLYSGVDGKRAKTCLPGFGDTVKGIDTTADGSWILATTDTYLMVVPTAITNDTKSRTGFQKSIPVKDRADMSAPRKLQLRAEDILQYGMSPIKFTTAHFDVGPDAERWIVTSSGPFIITWNFKKIKKGIVSGYKIKKCYQNVVADQFRYTHPDQIVVTCPDQVLLQKRKRKM
jgi:VID27 C-terminal WD40-like domain/VID27 PH-like domain